MSDSFDSRVFHKISSTVDNTYKHLKQKLLSNHGIWSNISKSDSQYGINPESKAFEVWNTWDNRKSIEYPGKEYSKIKQHSNSRIAPTRTASILSNYNFNTNRSNWSKSKRKDSQVIKKVDSEKRLNLKHTSKSVKQKANRHHRYHSKTKHYLKNSTNDQRSFL